MVTNVLDKKLCWYCVNSCKNYTQNDYILFKLIDSGEVHLVVCVLLSRDHVITVRVHHKTTGSSHSTFAILMPQKCL